MDSSQLKLVDQNLHPSMFQDDTQNIKMNLKQTIKINQDNTASNLVSPGKYNLTIDDSQMTGSNTRHLFKNLYGETLLTFLFFSKDNINNIQDIVKMIVYRETKQLIDNQSINELQIVMRSIFLSYNEHPKLLDPGMSEQEKIMLMTQYRNEVDRLNQLVINTVVPLVVSQMQQYIDYIKESSQPRQFMSPPINDSIAGTRQFRSVTSILTGSNL
jgi:hypothetical protein